MEIEPIWIFFCTELLVSLKVNPCAYIEMLYGCNARDNRWRTWDATFINAKKLVRPRRVSRWNEAGISKCICLPVICAVREKHLRMKGIRLNPTGKCVRVGGGMGGRGAWGAMKPLKNCEWSQILANIKPEKHEDVTEIQSPFIPEKCCTAIAAAEDGRGSSAPFSRPLLFCMNISGLPLCYDTQLTGPVLS